MKTIIVNESKFNSILEKKIKKSRMKTYEPSDDSFKAGFEPGGMGYGHISEEMEEDINPENVDLSSFKVKNRLHPLFWKDNILDSRVRMRLLDIADDFIDFLGIDWVDYDDIIITGSLANFNWSSKFSDIDLHIVMDYSKIDNRIKFVERFLKSQTILWNNEHEDLKICGFPVEIYVQDTDSELKAGGVFSLEKNEWIKEPVKDDLCDSCINKRWVQRKVASYMNKIDGLEEKFHKDKKDEYFLEKISLKLDKIFDDIKKERADGFKNGGEMNDRNIVFKTLRREGYIQKIKEMQKNIYNNINSL